jgi:tetratricopeptide (TPR) repeat protein
MCIALGEQWDENKALQVALISHVATYLLHSARYVEAESLYQRALYIGGETLQGENVFVAEALHGLAHLYREQGKYEEAEPLYLQALVIREQVLGGEHIGVSETLNELA